MYIDQLQKYSNYVAGVRVEAVESCDSKKLDIAIERTHEQLRYIAEYRGQILAALKLLERQREKVDQI